MAGTTVSELHPRERANPDRPPVAEWYIPSYREVRVACKATGHPLTELASEVGYKHERQLYTSQYTQSQLSTEKMFRCIDLLREWGSDVAEVWYLPTMGDINEEREERGITISTMSMLLGYETGEAWSVLFSTEHHMPMWRREAACWAFQRYDRDGYVPLPEEIPDAILPI